MRIILILPVFIISFSSQAQIGSFTDPRDGTTYETINIGDKIWFREHLRLKTSLSYFPSFSRDTSGLRYGNYYSNHELKMLCPPGWHIATTDELKAYIRTVARFKGVPDSAILQTISKNGDGSVRISLVNVNPMEDTLLKLAPIGWVEGNKIKRQKGLSLWVTDSQTNDDKFHVHIGVLGYVIHTHVHNIIDKPRLIRKFGVRCVCDL